MPHEAKHFFTLFHKDSISNDLRLSYILTICILLLVYRIKGDKIEKYQYKTFHFLFGTIIRMCLS